MLNLVVLYLFIGRAEIEAFNKHQFQPNQTRLEEEYMHRRKSLHTTNCIMTTIIADVGNGVKDFFQTSKGGAGLSAEADWRSDRLIVQYLKEHFPWAAILTEETAAANDHGFFANAEECWVVSPFGTDLDLGDDNFSVSIALLKSGIPVLGIIYFPTKQNLYAAQIDREGARLNGQKIQVSQTTQLDEMVVSCNRPWNIFDKVGEIKIESSVCAGLSQLAEGKIHAYVHTSLKPWDVAAAGLICQKAGAHVTNIRGEWWKSPFEETIFVSNNKGTKLALVQLMHDYQPAVHPYP